MGKQLKLRRNFKGLNFNIISLLLPSHCAAIQYHEAVKLLCSIEFQNHETVAPSNCNEDQIHQPVTPLFPIEFQHHKPVAPLRLRKLKDH